MFWFDRLRQIIPNHVVTADVEKYPVNLNPYGEAVARPLDAGDEQADMMAIECVVRGYVSGSAWKEYKESGSVCGITLPKGLRESDLLTTRTDFHPGHKSSHRTRREHLF